MTEQLQLPLVLHRTVQPPKTPVDRESKRRYYERNRATVIAKATQWRKDNPDKQREKQQKHRKKYPIKTLLYKAKRRAKNKGIEFSIKDTDLMPFPTHCAVLGYELIYGSNKKTNYNSASVDRFDNTKGYTKENTRIISTRANALKNDGTLEEFKKIVEYLEDK